MQVFEVARRAPLFFMHMPKTAGMSMRAYLENQYYAKDICPAVGWSDLVNSGTDVSSFRLVHGHFQYNMRSALPPGTKCLTVLRDPLLRTISALRHLQRDPAFHPDHALAKDLSLKQILRTPRLMLRQKNIQAAALCASAAPAAVIESLRKIRPGQRDADPADLEAPATYELAAQRLEEIEFLGFTDKLWMVLAQLSGEMNYHPAEALPAINDAPNQLTALDGLDAEDIELLKQYNDIDLKIYARAKEILAQRQFEKTMLDLIERGVYTRQRGSFRLDLRSPIPGTGWYEAESEGSNNVWRWTGPDRDLTLGLPLLAQESYRVVLQFRSPRPLDEADIAISANGQSLECDISQQDRLYTLSATIPSECLTKFQGCCRLVFNIGMPMRVSNNSEGDQRILGVAVSSVVVNQL
jgi:hypothetical protein